MCPCIPSLLEHTHPLLPTLSDLNRLAISAQDLDQLNSSLQLLLSVTDRLDIEPSEHRPLRPLLHQFQSRLSQLFSLCIEPTPPAEIAAVQSTSLVTLQLFWSLTLRFIPHIDWLHMSRQWCSLAEHCSNNPTAQLLLPQSLRCCIELCERSSKFAVELTPSLLLLWSNHSELLNFAYDTLSSNSDFLLTQSRSLSLSSTGHQLKTAQSSTRVALSLIFQFSDTLCTALNRNCSHLFDPEPLVVFLSTDAHQTFCRIIQLTSKFSVDSPLSHRRLQLLHHLLSAIVHSLDTSIALCSQPLQTDTQSFIALAQWCIDVLRSPHTSPLHSSTFECLALLYLSPVSDELNDSVPQMFQLLHTLLDSQMPADTLSSMLKLYLALLPHITQYSQAIPASLLKSLAAIWIRYSQPRLCSHISTLLEHIGLAQHFRHQIDSTGALFASLELQPLLAAIGSTTSQSELGSPSPLLDSNQIQSLIEQLRPLEQHALLEVRSLSLSLLLIDTHSPHWLPCRHQSQDIWIMDGALRTL